MILKHGAAEPFLSRGYALNVATIIRWTHRCELSSIRCMLAGYWSGPF